ncbi:MAG: response regulator transcription factor [Bryobacteraceae bacterium]
MGSDLVRVVIADDHAGALFAFSQIITGEFDVVGKAINGREAVLIAGKLKPDVVVLDIEMPVMNGLDAARKLILERSNARIIFLTVHADVDYVQAALILGAAGYVLKSRAALDLTKAIRMAMLGRQFISPGAGPQ